MNQNVSSLVAGTPYQLYFVERLSTSSLFARRLDIFIPLILVASLSFLGLALGFAYLRAKTRSTWDPPAGVVYGKVQSYL